MFGPNQQVLPPTVQFTEATKQKKKHRLTAGCGRPESFPPAGGASPSRDCDF